MPTKLPSPEIVRALLREGVQHAEQLLAERQGARESASRLNAELERMASERRQLEERQATLTSLQAASSELHARLEVESVLEALKEIIINLLGSESFAIYLVGQGQAVLRVCVEVGVPALAPRAMAFGHGPIGQSVFSDAPWIEVAQSGADDPQVVIPLKVHEQVVGTVAIFRFLKQKKGITDLDRDLFRLLSAQAATALHGAALYAKEARRAATFEGLVELVRGANQARQGSG